MDLILVDLQIIEVGEVFIKDIPNVRVKVVKSPGNKLMIGSIETTASQTPETAGGEECTTLMCKWIAFAKDKVEKVKNKVKNCHGKNGAGGKGVGHATFGDDRGMLHHGHPGAGHGHGHGHHGGGHRGEQPEHTFGKLVKNIFMHILLPVLIGIVAGVSVSL